MTAFKYAMLLSVASPTNPSTSSALPTSCVHRHSSYRRPVQNTGLLIYLIAMMCHDVFTPVKLNLHMFDDVFCCIISLFFMSNKYNIVCSTSSRGFVLIKLSWAISFVLMTLKEITVLIIGLIRGQTQDIFHFR